MPITDKQMISFLYSIIKQLEVRHVDWDLVARCNDITRGHTARMRFHRLRLAQDGILPKVRGKDKDFGEEKGKRKETLHSDVKRKRTTGLGLGKGKKGFDDDTDDDEYGSDVPLAKMKGRVWGIKHEDIKVEEGELVVKVEETNAGSEADRVGQNGPVLDKSTFKSENVDVKVEDPVFSTDGAPTNVAENDEAEKDEDTPPQDTNSIFGNDTYFSSQRRN
ncbi:hypothetical protein EJ08DRAFT_318231 [Tothia fuscella]|uniref:Myb-like DNA-binding domain-containing protein n=1 Tax=Tothia fuscella TaxID=1048955 RepID=A0A9P4TX06_9PEZI|nr:hypothetical protein EJ08DRAFT_318231 [Tothia fuscella]